MEKIIVDLWKDNPPTISGLIGEEKIDATAALEITNVTKAELTIIRPVPKENKGIAMIICPGGAYAGLAITLQGYEFAEWLASIGIVGIVLKYRMPNSHKEIPLDDLYKAIEYVHIHAMELGVNLEKIGLVGFSAGEHLAALASEYYNSDIRLRPKFSILFYPVITMGKYTHGDSLHNLLGTHASDNDLDYYSCEKHVTKDVPPTLILVSDDDSLVSPINSILYYKSLKQCNIPSAMYVFASGDHAWGINGKNAFGNTFKYSNMAKELIYDWLREFV